MCKSIWVAYPFQDHPHQGSGNTEEDLAAHLGITCIYGHALAPEGKVIRPKFITSVDRDVKRAYPCFTPCPLFPFLLTQISSLTVPGQDIKLQNVHTAMPEGHLKTMQQMTPDYFPMINHTKSAVCPARQAVKRTARWNKPLTAPDHTSSRVCYNGGTREKGNA